MSSNQIPFLPPGVVMGAGKRTMLASSKDLGLWTKLGANVGEADKCRTCGITAKAMKAAVLMCCNVCAGKRIRVLYCSRDCQKVDYRVGSPPDRAPHKSSCGKTHVDPTVDDEDLAIVHSALDTKTLRLYTKTPTTALQAQLDFLGRNPTAHYGFRRKNGRYIAHQIQGEGGVLFLQMRKEVMEERNLASLAVMERLLLVSVYPTDVYTAGDYVWQLEREYEADLQKCHELFDESPRHLKLYDEWVDWAKPRVRTDDPTKGVRFQLPGYHFLGTRGEFVHPKLLPAIRNMLLSPI
ncbi:hypothetical protein C8R47DRAFT_1230671 [Mycena vitilis]|nr:hypothetical protein C8R47DRAFT_1230671 [Mycena vitilis]